jgi:hypothetical protein
MPSTSALMPAQYVIEAAWSICASGVLVGTSMSSMAGWVVGWDVFLGLLDFVLVRLGDG